MLSERDTRCILHGSWVSIWGLQSIIDISVICISFPIVIVTCNSDSLCSYRPLLHLPHHKDSAACQPTRKSVTDQLTLFRLYRTVNPCPKNSLVHESSVIFPHNLGAEHHSIFDELAVCRRQMRQKERSDQMQDGREERVKWSQQIAQYRGGWRIGAEHQL